VFIGDHTTYTVRGWPRRPERRCNGAALREGRNR
jgi:hypothetical protein